MNPSYTKKMENQSKSSDTKHSKANSNAKYVVEFQKKLHEFRLRKKEEERLKKAKEQQKIQKEVENQYFKRINHSSTLRYHRKKILSLLSRDASKQNKKAVFKNIIYAFKNNSDGKSEGKSLTSHSPGGGSKPSINTQGSGFHFKNRRKWSNFRKKNAFADKQNTSQIKAMSVVKTHRRGGMYSRSSSVFNFESKKISKKKIDEKIENMKKKNLNKFNEGKMRKILRKARKVVGVKKELIFRMKDRNDMMKSEKDGNDFFKTLNRLIKKSGISNFQDYQAENGNQEYFKLKEFYSKQINYFMREDRERDFRLKMKDLALEDRKALGIEEKTEDSKLKKNREKVKKLKSNKSQSVRDLRMNPDDDDDYETSIVGVGRRKIASFNFSDRKEARDMFGHEFKIQLKTAKNFMKKKKRKSLKTHKILKKNRKKFKILQKKLSKSERKQGKQGVNSRSLPFIEKKVKKFFKSIDENKNRFRYCEEKSIITEAINRSQILNEDFLYRLKNITNADRSKKNDKREVKKIRSELDKTDILILGSRKKTDDQLAFTLSKPKIFKVHLGSQRRSRKGVIKLKV